MNKPIPPTGCAFKAQSASGLVKTGEGDCVLVLVSSSSSAVLNIYDNTAASGTKIVDSLAVDAKEEYDIPAHFTTGLYVELASGTGKWTVFFI